MMIQRIPPTRCGGQSSSPLRLSPSRSSPTTRPSPLHPEARRERFAGESGRLRLPRGSLDDRPQALDGTGKGVGHVCRRSHVLEHPEWCGQHRGTAHSRARILRPRHPSPRGQATYLGGLLGRWQRRCAYHAGNDGLVRQWRRGVRGRRQGWRPAHQGPRRLGPHHADVMPLASSRVARRRQDVGGELVHGLDARMT